MPSSKRVRRFLRRVGDGVKDIFKPSDQATPSQTPSPPPRVPPTYLPHPLAPSHGSSSAIPPLPLAQSQSAFLSLPALSLGQWTPSALSVVDYGNQPTNAESSLAPAAKKAGADAWIGLKAALRLLERSADALPPLKSAVGGFLGVVDIFEASHLTPCTSPRCLLCYKCRALPKTRKTTQSSEKTFKIWSTNSGNTRASKRPPTCLRL